MMMDDNWDKYFMTLFDKIGFNLLMPKTPKS